MITMHNYILEEFYLGKTIEVLIRDREALGKTQGEIYG